MREDVGEGHEAGVEVYSVDIALAMEDISQEDVTKKEKLNNSRGREQENEEIKRGKIYKNTCT